MLVCVSRIWHTAFRLQYRILALIDPLVRIFWRRFGIGNTLELRVQRRDGQGVRSRLVGLLRADGHRYLGHPNGEVGWTRDLEAAGRGVLVWRTGGRLLFSATRLEPGEEREHAILATGQHPFPGNVTYRLGRGHIRRVGVFFRVESASASSQPDFRDVG
jgi:hypothetical protein